MRPTNSNFKLEYDIFGTIFNGLNDDELEESRFQLKPKNIISIEDTYMIEKVSAETQYEINFLMSGLHYLFQLVLKIRKKRVFPKKVFKYIEVINGLINFLYGEE